jgi:hypothetical protein
MTSSVCRSSQAPPPQGKLARQDKHTSIDCVRRLALLLEKGAEGASKNPTLESDRFYQAPRLMERHENRSRDEDPPFSVSACAFR